MSEKMQRAFEENQARAAEADRAAQAAEAQKKAAADAAWAEYSRKRRRKATAALACRALFVAALVLGLRVSLDAGLIHELLAHPIEAAAVVWLALWTGAWIQFMFCKRGLME